MRPAGRRSVGAAHRRPRAHAVSGVCVRGAWGREMSDEILIAQDESGRQERFRLRVFFQQDRWTAELTPLDTKGRPVERRVAPRFYGLTAEQARRRIIRVLEDQFDEVTSLGPGPT